MRQGLFKVISNSSRFSPAVLGSGGEELRCENDQAAELLRASTFLRSTARTLIDQQGLLPSGSSCSVAEGPSNIFMAFLTALSFPMVSIITEIPFIAFLNELIFCCKLQNTCLAFRGKLMEFVNNNEAMVREKFTSWRDLSEGEFAAMLESIGNGDSGVQLSDEIVACISMMTGFNIVIFEVAAAGEVVNGVTGYDIFYSTERLGMALFSNVTHINY